MGGPWSTLVLVADRHPSFGAFAQAYILDLARRKSPSIDVARSVFRGLISYFGDQRLDGIEPKHVVVWLRMLEAEGRAPKTTLTHKACLPFKPIAPPTEQLGFTFEKGTH